MSGGTLSRIKNGAVALFMTFMAASCAVAQDNAMPNDNNPPPCKPNDEYQEVKKPGAHDLYKGSNIIGPTTVPTSKENLDPVDVKTRKCEELELHAE